MKSNKKQKLGEEEEESGSKSSTVDWISSLPVEVLTTNILCRIPLKDAVCTSTLSRRWRPLFHRMPDLVFNANNPPGGAYVNYQSKWWDTVLNVVRSRGQYYSISPSCFIIRIDQTIKHGQADHVLKLLFPNPVLRTFTFLNHGETRYLIPHDLFKCGSLVDLHLCKCTLKLPDFDFVGLHCLKKLQLNNIHVSKIDLETLVHRCKSLEKLELSLFPHTRRYWKGTLNISSNSLVSIEYRRTSFHWGISLKGVGPSLKQASFIFDHHCNLSYNQACREKQRFLQLLMGSGNVECLSFRITHLYSEVFREMPERLPRTVLLINLKKLVLLMDIHITIFHPFLSFLLHSSPNLEELYMKSKFYNRPYTPNPSSPHSWEYQGPVPCPTQKLKHVKLLCTNGLEQTYAFAKFVLKNAKALKTLILYVQNTAEYARNFEKLGVLGRSDTTIFEIKNFNEFWITLPCLHQ